MRVKVDHYFILIADRSTDNLDILLKTVYIATTSYNQEFIIKERRESIQLSQYPVQTHCVKFGP